jgi:hypothetical protein
MSKTVPLLGQTAQDIIETAAQIAIHGFFSLKRKHGFLRSIYQN